MPILLKLIILAVVQGIAEFLPISFSGHLAILQNFFNIQREETLLVSVVLHAGTLVAILIFYFHEVISLFNKKQWNVLICIVIGTIPAGVLGVLIKLSGVDELVFSSLYIAGIGLIITAIILKFGINRKGGEKSIEDISIKESLLIGFFQAFAIFPGISRSGSTISGALIKGLKSSEAAKFSFLLAIPAIGGAAFVEVLSYFLKLHEHVNTQAMSILYLIIGFLISAVVGYISLKVLIKLLDRNRLSIFAYYCLIVGIAVIVGNFFIH